MPKNRHRHCANISAQIKLLNEPTELCIQDRSQIGIIKRGQLCVCINDVKFTLYPGDVILLGSDDTYTAAPESPCEICRLSFDRDLASSSIGDAILAQGRKVVRLDQAQLDTVISLFDTLRDIRISDAPSSLDISIRLLECILLVLCDENTRGASRSYDGLDMQRAVDYIESHFSENPSLHTVARLVHLSDQYFCTEFRKYMRINFKEFLKTRKLQHARRLLITSDLPVSVVAESCGYSSQSHFNREFKDYFALTPLKMRKIYSKSRLKDNKYS